MLYALGVAAVDGSGMGSSIRLELDGTGRQEDTKVVGVTEEEDEIVGWSHDLLKEKSPKEEKKN